MLDLYNNIFGLQITHFYTGSYRTNYSPKFIPLGNNSYLSQLRKNVGMAQSRSLPIGSYPTFWAKTLPTTENHYPSLF
ncbi:hypothetical protein A2634_01425 [Candidatus Amesbacteria bacterium RIFCSPHIGHO2_01_FULL_48_32]|uniref:Uncharacterized protein n=1 Tax=Candidatus Amesbacteria bacterium RIFCSPLOWO2_01_FULL_48_25 TaxID=1797259 RepID=A0A1F4ZBQ2_9BACT|nr:MAG: hypothetical protein A2634_01425 [Candidatus Amesbacteria bacterium RIFCSPHIGHO2_01_FULL_48_32]OGD03703.1 MAG: hypothetical protein A2989_03410 [Candidatus Amesbacteria bacterium RIFCSPLOWO2_01_FULL_48_25]